MMKLIKILTLFLAPTIMAQGTRFVYQVVSTPDSTQADAKKTELAYLDTDGSKSFFYGETRLKRDSLMERMRATRSFDPTQMENLRSSIEFVVEKDHLKQSLMYKSRIGRDQYTYNENPNFEWKILPETIKIGGYDTQKAETEYGGRKWTAWFTTQIPMQDGPYKFSGLPGLIVKLQDSKGDYSFDLMQVKKIAQIQEPQARGQYISIDKNKYLELEKSFQKNPVSMLNAQRGGGGRGFGTGGQSRGQGGQRNPQQMQEMQKRMEKEIKSRNNPIELK